MDQATILYPNTLKIPVNVKDSIDVSYESTWSQVNLTLLCRAATSNIYSFYNVPDNPLKANGTKLTTSIESMNLGIKNFPGDCVFRLTQYGDINVHVDGTSFSLTSQEAQPRTFGISSTVGLSTNTSTRSASTTTTTSGTSSTQTSTNSAQSTKATSLSTSEDSSSGLSKGTQAAIGVGVTFGVLLILAAVFTWAFFALRKRQRKRAAVAPGDDNHEQAELFGDPAGNRPPAWFNPGKGNDTGEKYGVHAYVTEKDGAQLAAEMPTSQAYRSYPRHELE